jgi:photosystem II stability/assembly factor-like uncharacterized protein
MLSTDGDQAVKSLGLGIALAAVIYIFGFGARAHADQPVNLSQNAAAWTQSIQPRWSRLNYFKNINAINFSWDNSAYLAMDDGTVFISRDNGKNFREARLPINGDVMRLSSSDTGTIVAASAREYAISDDHGKTWTSYRLDASTTIRNFSTPNGQPGIAWVELVTTYPPGNPRVGKVVLRRHSRDRSTPNEQPMDQDFDLIRASSDMKGWGIKGSQVFRTEDGGAHWTLAASLPLEPGETVMQAQQFDQELAFGTSAGRLFNIATTLQALPPIPTDHIFSVAFTGGSSAMAVTTNNIILFTKDFRTGSWNQRVSETSVSSVIGWRAEQFLILTQNGQLRLLDPQLPSESIVVDQITGDVQAAAMDDHNRAILWTNRGELLSSVDGGRSWKMAFRVRGSVGPAALGSDGDGVAVVNGTDVRQTSDGGQTWRPVSIDLPGPVVSLAIRDHIYGIAQVRRGDAWRSDYVLYSIQDGRWTPLPATESFSFMRWGGPNRLFGITDQGGVSVSLDVGRSWKKLPSDVSEAFKAIAKRGKEKPSVVDAEFLEDGNGWIIGSEWMFHTENNGASWTQVDDPQFKDSSFKLIHFFDANRGIVYDATGTQWFYRTNDGGKTWNYYDPFARINDVKATAFSPNSTGLFVGSNGTQVLEKLEDGPALTAQTESTGLDSIRLTVLRKDRLFRLADLKGAPKLMVRIKGWNRWETVDLPKSVFAETDKGIEASWRPSQQEFRIEPGQVISQKIEVEDVNGYVTDVPFHDLEYQPFIQRHKEVLVWTIIAITVLFGSAGLLLTLYILRPVLLIRVVKNQDDFCELLKPFHLDVFASVFRVLLFNGILQRMCLTERVQSSWIRNFLLGQDTIGDLPDALRLEMIKTERVLDAWVARRRDAIRKYLETQLGKIGCGNYIPLPVSLRARDRQLDIHDPSGMALRAALMEDQHIIGIVAGGGRGKTTLAGQIGLWLMETRPEEQMIPGRSPLAILIVGEIADVLATVRNSLQAAFHEEDGAAYSDTVLGEALRRRRLVLIADGLSEVSKATVEHLRDCAQTVPISLLIYTARKSFSDMAMRATSAEITPQEIEMDGVSRFIAEYVLRNRRQSIITARDQLLLSEKVIDLIDRRHGYNTLPALFLRILITSFENANEAQRAAWRNDAPLSLAETAQRFIRELRPPADLGSIDSEGLARAATNLSRLSLGSAFVAQPFSAADARTALEGLPGAEIILRALEDCTVIQREVVSTGTRYRFYLDPVAEYLAATSWMLQCGGDLRAWGEHFAALRRSIERGAVVYGYVDALADCIVAQPPGSIPPRAVRDWALQPHQAMMTLVLDDQPVPA